MRQITSHKLWIGHAGDARDIRSVLDHEIEAVIQLAVEEPLLNLTRELAYCRFPLIDGGGNPPWLLEMAVHTTALLIEGGTPTLLACSNGMSRSPCVAAFAIARLSGRPPDDCLAEIVSGGAADVAPDFWNEFRHLAGFR